MDWDGGFRCGFWRVFIADERRLVEVGNGSVRGENYSGWRDLFPFK